MFIAIFGKPNCPYCDKAKAAAAEFVTLRDGAAFRYIDITESGITKADLSRQAGKEVETVPQIFIGNEHIGGCDEFLAHLKEQFSFEAQV